MVDSPIPAGFSKRELLSSAHRELERRRREYPRRVAMGKMTSADAQEQTDRMRAIVQTLEAVADRPAAQPPLPLAAAAGAR